MANANQPVWDGMVQFVTFTASTTSTPFVVPKNAGAITIIMPTMATDTSYAIHGLEPQDKTTWRAVFAWDPGDASSTAVGAIPHNQYTVIPASALGCGTFRLVAPATAQTLTVSIIIDRLI